MRVAITGGTGFIGTWLVRELCPRLECKVLTRRQPDIMTCRPDGNVQYLVTDYSLDQLVLQLREADAVVHLAAQRYEPPLTMRDYLPSVEIAYNVWEACRVLGIANVVHLSSIAVYGAGEPLPWGEAQPTLPMTLYGISKLAAEHVAHIYNQKHGLRIKALRVAQVLGIGERAGYMVTEFFDRARAKRPLLVFGEGTGRRQYIYVRDVVRAIEHCLARPDVSGAFNIGMEQNVSHAELACAINRAFGNEGLEYLPDRAEDKTQQIMAIDKAKAELDWAPQWSLQEALEDIRLLLDVGGRERMPGTRCL